MGVIRHFSSSSNDLYNGIKHFSSSSNDNNNKNYEEFTPSPKIENYSIIKSVQLRKNLVVLINYKDVTNYEGNKIMIYENCTIEQLVKQELIDPHFSNNKNILSPIARFEPTDQGWELALFVAENI